MKKKYILVAGLAAACMALAACGSKEPAGTAANVNQQAEVQAGYEFTAKSTTMQVNGKLSDYVAKLGEPSGGTYEAKSCAFDGMDKFYYYDGFTLQAYQKDGEDLIYAITLSDDSVKTAEGVRIGQGKDKMEAAYGTTTETAGQYVYTKGNTQLTFVVKDNVIQSIEYVLAV